jgi:hypothetical protein
MQEHDFEKFMTEHLVKRSPTSGSLTQKTRTDGGVEESTIGGITVVEKNPNVPVEEVIDDTEKTNDEGISHMKVG